MTKLILDEPYRLRMMALGVMIAVGSSVTYAFSVYSEYMKEKYGMTQFNITTISTVGNCLGFSAFILGVIYDHYGPKVQIIVSGVLTALGLLLFGFAFDDLFTYSTNTMVILFSVFNGIMFLGCPSLDGAVLLPLIMHFPLDRGYIIIIQKTFSGLGTSIIMAYFIAFFKATSLGGSSKFSAFSYFLAVQAMVVAVVGAIFIDLPAYDPCDRVKRKLSPAELKERQDTLKIYMKVPSPRFRFYIGCTIVGLLLVFLTATSLIGSSVTFSLAAERGIWVVSIVLLCCFSVMALPFQCLGRYRVPDRPSKFPGLGEVNENEGEGVSSEEGERRCSTTESVANGDAEGEVEASSSTAEPQEQRNDPVGGLHVEAQDAGATPKGALAEESEDSDGNAIVKFGSSGDPQYHGSFWSHLLTIDLWLFWLSFFSLFGTGTVLIFNAAQLYRSKAYGTFSVSQQALYVGLIGVGSAIGRILSGVIDLLVARRRTTGEKKKDIYTIMFFPIGTILLAIAFLLIAVLPAPAIVLPFILGAMGNGMGWGLSAICVRSVYAEDFGKHYYFMWSSGIVATVGLNLFMFGGMFDKAADNEGTSPMCDSPKCVIPQMWILLGCNVVSTLAAFALQWRFCRFSNRRLKEVEADEEQELQRVLALCEEKEKGEGCWNAANEELSDEH